VQLSRHRRTAQRAGVNVVVVVTFVKAVGFVLDHE
jgi:hypothetical protein